MKLEALNKQWNIEMEWKSHGKLQALKEDWNGNFKGIMLTIIRNRMEVKTYRMKLKYSTGLPKKDETSETIVRKLCCLIPYDSLQL